jgi:hypothetical protein
MNRKSRDTDPFNMCGWVALHAFEELPVDWIGIFMFYSHSMWKALYTAEFNSFSFSNLFPSNVLLWKYAKENHSLNNPFYEERVPGINSR